MSSFDDFEHRTGRPPREATRLANIGRDPARQNGFVNPPIQRGSTVLFPTVEALEAYDQDYVYGRRGTPTTRMLEAALCALDGAAACVLTPSGYMAVTVALLSFTSAGGHVLITDNVYHPVREFCKATLSRFGVEVEFYDPLIGGDIATLFRANTQAVLTEAPGSQTMEMQDIPAIAAAARQRDIWVLMDNTWATPLYFRPLDNGVDVAIQAGTKYLVGHSDAMLGAVTATGKAAPFLKRTHGTLGVCASPEDCFLALRGLRTLGVRLERHWQNAMIVAQWLAARPEVDRVLFPALPGDAGHALWLRDFTGASGLFSVVLNPVPDAALRAMLNQLTLFGMGFSWGGFESLVVPFKPARTAVPWIAAGPCLRFHIGLEDTDDLIADLDAAMGMLRG